MSLTSATQCMLVTLKYTSTASSLTSDLDLSVTFRGTYSSDISWAAYSSTDGTGSLNLQFTNSSVITLPISSFTITDNDAGTSNQIEIGAPATAAFDGVMVTAYIWADKNLINGERFTLEAIGITPEITIDVSDNLNPGNNKCELTYGQKTSTLAWNKMA